MFGQGCTKGSFCPYNLRNSLVTICLGGLYHSNFHGLAINVSYPCKSWQCKDWKTYWKNTVSIVKRTRDIHGNISYSLLNIIVNCFSYVDNQFIKSRCSVPLGMNIRLGSYEFSLQAIIDHHGLSVYCGHYTTFVFCCGKNILLQQWQNYCMSYKSYPRLFHNIYHTVYIYIYFQINCEVSL